MVIRKIGSHSHAWKEVTDNGKLKLPIVHNLVNSSGKFVSKVKYILDESNKKN